MTVAPDRFGDEGEQNPAYSRRMAEAVPKGIASVSLFERAAIFTPNVFLIRK